MKLNWQIVLLVLWIFASCNSSKIIELGLDEYLPGKVWQTNRVSTVTTDSITTTQSSNATLTFADECTLIFDEASTKTEYFYYLSETQNEINIFKTGFIQSDEKDGFSIFSVNNFFIRNKTADYMLWELQDTIVNNTTGSISYIKKSWELNLIQ